MESRIPLVTLLLAGGIALLIGVAVGFYLDALI